MFLMLYLIVLANKLIVRNDEYVRNCHDFGEFNNEAEPDNGMIFDRYSDASGDNSYNILTEEDHRTVLSL